ncbi:DUF5908 family protein [Hymenobacter jejuensis]|uniref:Uncharacterized protein n=1 Tax=Hymenobacter jejuensis TaxID=2502781 RepID=A0A5B8A2Q9_9BACT|nr:DUF5908 family protein [Hymenobacter jejuensis]QDA61598.1 hypothetical protein FHG12_16505 [Hymenobacter jejuensis]
MPLEIKELYIRVTVNAPENQAPASRPTTLLAATRDGSAEAEKQAIIAECVEQVAQIFQAKQER